VFLALLPAIDESDESELSEIDEREKARVSKVECKPLVEASADLQVLLCNSVFHATTGSQVYRAATEQFDRFTARQRKDQTFSAILDSGADVHIWTLADAEDLFQSKGVSNLKVIGVNGVPARADLAGHLIVVVRAPSGEQYQIDLGQAHAMRSCPMNLLSVSLLIQIGAIIHFEKDNCWFKASAGAVQIPFQQRDGLFHLEISPPKEAEPDPPLQSFAVDGRCYAVGNLHLWHRRMRHLSKLKLLNIMKSKAVGGFKVKGNKDASCSCDACSQAKIQRSAIPHVRGSPDPATFVGHTVSVDTKTLPFATIPGYKYALCFVDHFSRYGMVFFMRKKSETADKVKEYILEMRRLGHRVRRIQCDRGSEFYEQEGDTLGDRDRREHAFGQMCRLYNVQRVLQPVEFKEKLAEAWFKEHFKAASVMLWEARLTPALWDLAVAYSQLLFNMCPNSHVGDDTTPLTLVTGEVPQWHKIRVFGSQVFQHIPNNPYYKVPGVPKGQMLIFVGFERDKGGWRCFDPETRRFFSTGNCYFNEDFSHRIDALRHHDRRRALLKRNAEQPIIIDDFDDDSNADAVRSLYLPADAPYQENEVVEPSTGREHHGAAADGGGVGEHSSAQPVQPDPSRFSTGPLTPRAVTAERVRGFLREGVPIRPLRLLPVHSVAPFTPEDQRFIQFGLVNKIPAVYLSPCPKRGNSARRYLKYMHASNLGEAIELGATREDIKWDYRRGFIKFPRHENDMPGHVFPAFQLAEEHNVVHVLQAARRKVRNDFRADAILEKAFHAASSRSSFNQILETVYEPEVIVEQLKDRETMLRFAEQSMSKVLNSQTLQVDYSISPDPLKFEEVLPDVCPESNEWFEAMRDEMKSMERFGVYKRVHRSAAQGHQILGCRWVYKRKSNRFGVITRYRARLVAQGFLQRAYDSFQPDELYSPVVHKDTLRMFLSLCAAENLQVFQADVKAAFLQAPLRETIFLRCPPGFESKAGDGSDEVLALEKAVYGLKQSSAAFWEAMNAHLTALGYKSILGDPCLFRKVLPDGRVILVCTYIDDVTYGVSDQATGDHVLGELRQRFIIEEGEGKAIDYLLGIAVDQNLDAGTIRMSMELAISKLCRGVLTEHELAKSVTVDTPMIVSPLLKQTERTVSKAEFDYLSVVGSLLHIANCVRCDISYAVGVLARHANAPGPAHVRAAKRVLQYLHRTSTYGITYTRQASGSNVPLMYEGAKHPLDNGSNLLQTFADSDYAGDETRRSTMGYVIMMNGGPIMWSSVLAKTVAMSTCEAEVSAAVAAAKDALHLSRMLVDLGYSDGRPLQIAEDNAACIAQAETGLRHVRNARHYAVRLRFLQELVVNKEVEFKYCPTDVQLADVFTKPLDSDKFVRFRDALMTP
jgi:hypothetical protein